MATQFQPRTLCYGLRETEAIFQMAELISRSLRLQRITCPIRIHGNGDYFSPLYVAAWAVVARMNPGQTFYSYTKSIPQVLEVYDKGLIPSNFKFTASMGGKYDQLAMSRPDAFPRRAWVVFSEEEAAEKGWHVDHDDLTPQSDWTGDFALLLHGSQPAGSAANAALQALKKKGITGYGRKSSKGKPKLFTLKQCQEHSTLYFSPGNSKVVGAVLMSLPAGHTCPGACKCLSKADRYTRKVTDGPATEFRCFAASSEAQYTSFREAVWHNLDSILKAFRSGE